METRTGKIYISADGDPNNLISKANGTILPNDLGRIEIAIAPSNNDYVYLCCATQSGGFYITFINQLMVANHTRVIGPGGSATLNIFGSNNQGWYDNVSCCFPKTTLTKIIVGGIDSWIGEQVFYNYCHSSWTQKIIMVC